jgi:very-short-patch-repair endonuclease
MRFINKFAYIKDPDAKNAMAEAAKLRAQIMNGKGISTDEYKKKYIEEVLYGQSKNARQNAIGTRPERKVGFALKGLGLKVWKEYKVIGHYYDYYLPDLNILVEVDGVFWHPESLEEAKYVSQKNNYFNDIVKNAIASAKGIPLIRIREDKINQLDGQGLRDELDRLIQEVEEKRAQESQSQNSQVEGELKDE